jgi:two-component system, OmpR family, sensor histidine kinase VicK
MDELLGKEIHHLVHHTHADGSPYPASECPTKDVVRTGETRHMKTEVFWRKDGTSLPVDYTAVPVRGDGGVTGVVVSFHDISEQLAVDRMKDEFISIVSHELRTPLGSIRGSLGLLAAGLLGTLPERGSHMLDLAIRNTDRLIRLVSDILDIERIESGRATFQLRPEDAGELVTRSVESMSPAAEAAQVRLTCDAESLPVEVDPDRIQQALTNLVGNAIKFSDAGSEISVSVRPREQEALFSVRDEGRGIPADKLEKVFQRFEQVDVSDSRQKGGTGLGLAITRSIVRQHGGRIWVESALGEGSTFYFTVPLAHAGVTGR